MFIACKLDNFRVQMFDLKPERAEEYYAKRREWEAERGQRFGVYDQGQLCGAFRVMRASDEY